MTVRTGARWGLARLARLATIVVLLLATVGGARADGPAGALPVVVERGTIVVRAQAGLERQARRVASRAVRDLAAIALDLDGLDTPASIEIRIVGDTAELPTVAPPGRGAPRWAAGVAYPDLGVIALAVRRGGRLHDLDKTLTHELAHLALGAAIADAPRWLHEGFAWQRAREFDGARLQTLAGLAWFGGVRPLDELEAGFPVAEAPASKAYAQSYDFVGFLAERGRWPDRADDGDRWPFRRYLRALAGGASLDEAAALAYGVPMDDLFLEWRASLTERYMLIPASVFASALWVLAAMLLVLGWWRRRRRSRAQMAVWDAEERAAAARRVPSTAVVPPTPTAIDQAALDDAEPGGDPPTEGTDEGEPPGPPRWIN